MLLLFALSVMQYRYARTVKKIQARVGFWLLLSPHRSMLFKGTFEHIFCRKQKMGKKR